MSRYTATTFTGAQSSIACCPWRRIYTTNYDNVLELCLGAAKRSYRLQTCDDTPSTPPPEHTDIVHLNGFIHRTMVDTIHSDLRLTSVSYAMTEFSPPWALTFRSDIRFSKAAIFVGYSLSDLDITRLISTEAAYTDKCVFIVAPTPSTRDTFRLPRYGTMLADGVERAAQALEAIAARFIKPERSQMFYSFEERVTHSPPEPPNDDARFDLLLRGALHYPMLTGSIADFKTSPYVISRDALETVVKRLREGTPLQVIHSHIGNGKTILAESVCIRAAEMGWKCFKLDRERPRLYDEINHFLTSTERSLLVLEHYPTHFDLLRELFTVHNTALYVILTARTSAHEIFSDRLREIAGTRSVVEHDLNKLSDDEMGSLNSLLETVGYSHGSLTGRGRGKRNRREKHRYYRDFQAILLDFINSPAIRGRIQEAYDELCKMPDLELFVVTGFILDGIGFGKDAFLLTELVDQRVSIAELTKRCPSAKEFLSYRDGEFTSRSPVLARFVLTSLETSGSVGAALLALFRKVSGRRTASHELRELFRLLMQYAQIEALFPNKK